MQAQKKSLQTWVAGADGNPRHHRLLLHALCNRVTPLVRDLLAAGASARVQPYDEPEDKSGTSPGSFFIPLCYAVSASDAPYDPIILDLLLDGGADPFELIPAGSTHRTLMASAIDSPKAIEDLLRRGYHPDMLLNMENGKSFMQDETALQHACMGMFDKHTPTWTRRKVVQLLIKGGVDLEQRQHITGKTPLLLAVMFEPILIGPLISYGASVDARDNNGDGVMEALDIVRKDNSHMSLAYFHAMKQKFSALMGQSLEDATLLSGISGASKPRL